MTARATIAPPIDPRVWVSRRNTAWTANRRAYTALGHGSGDGLSRRRDDNQSPNRIGTDSASIEPALTECTDNQVNRPFCAFVVGAT